MSTKNRFSDNKTISKSTRLLTENAIEIHRWLLIITSAFSVVFTVVSIVLHDYAQALISILSLPAVFIAHLINRKGYLYESKLFNSAQIITMITAVSLFTGINSLAFMYFFPVIIATLLAFQGEEKRTGYFMILTILLLLIALTAIGNPIGQKHFNAEHLFLDRASNIIGVAVSCVLILTFLIKMMNKVQSQLIENTNVLIHNNTQLLAANYSRDQLMSVIAHDLRAPMVGAIMTADACLKEGISNESKKEMLTSLHDKASSILSMTDQLLEWSRSQTGNLQCKIEPIAVEHFDHYISEWTNLIGESKNIIFKLNFEFIKGETISCDKNMIQTILRNLISNAVKFSKNGSTIEISSYQKKTKRVFDIQDFGKGITHNQLIKLREGISFTTNGTNNEKGNGFGLQLVQEFLRRHHSHLEIHSEFGTGSLFSFKL